MVDSTLPKCGLYATGEPLEGKEAAVPAGALVYFHNHSSQGPPLVLLPEVNKHNRWQFAERGYLVDSPNAGTFVAALAAVPAEGFYVAQRAIQLPEDEVLAPGTLVQIGYNRRAQPILFPAEFHGNGFSFPTHGYRFEGLGIFELLRSAGFGPPSAQHEPEPEDTPPTLLH